MSRAATARPFDGGHAQSSETRPPILCLHGLGRTAADWDGVRAGLTAVGTVSSPMVPREPSLALELLRRTARPGTVLIGHSLGGLQALGLAVEPGMAPSAVVLTGCFFPPALNGRSLLRSTWDFGGHRIALATSLVRDNGIKRPRRGTGSALASMIALVARPTRSRAMLAAVRCPVLVVHARDDHHVPVDFALAAAARRPGWSLHVFDEGGHHLHMTRPDDWLGVVGPWLATHL